MNNFIACDSIKIKEVRIEIDEMTNDNIMADNSSFWILLEIDYRSPDSADKYFLTNKILKDEKIPDYIDITKKEKTILKII